MKKHVWLLVVLTAMMTAMACACAEDWALYDYMELQVDGQTADRVHLRAAPDVKSDSLGLYFTGTPAWGLTSSAGWMRVRIGGEYGWIQQEYLEESGMVDNVAFPIRAVTNPYSSFVNLRSAPSMEAEVLLRCDEGLRVTLMGETASGWSYVQADGQTGYMVTDFLVEVEAALAVETTRTEVVGTTPEGQYIHACDVGNGQMIYFVAWDAEPMIAREDVNFDGYPDVTVTTSRGATNCYSEFFVWQGGRYVRAEHRGADDGLANHVLYPELGYVLSSANGGNAGAMYKDCLFCWDGSDLRLIRWAESRSLRTSRMENGASVTILHDRKLELVVYGFDADGESTLLHTEIIDLNDMNADRLSEMKSVLWEGLR